MPLSAPTRKPGPPTRPSYVLEYAQVLIYRRPRWHDQLNGRTYFEYANPSHGLTGYDNSTVAYFRELGYNITYQDPLGGSTSHAISRLPNGNFLAQSDPRKWAGYGAAF